MARQLRLECEEAIRHVTVRVKWREYLFVGDAERRCLLERMPETVVVHGVRLICCLDGVLPKS